MTLPMLIVKVHHRVRVALLAPQRGRDESLLSRRRDAIHRVRVACSPRNEDAMNRVPTTGQQRLVNLRSL
jgi:hypothetical protein